jgi:hypothetical protein
MPFAVIVTTDSRAVAMTSVRSTTSTTRVPVLEAVVAVAGVDVEVGVTWRTRTTVAAEARVADRSDAARTAGILPARRGRTASRSWAGATSARTGWGSGRGVRGREVHRWLLGALDETQSSAAS